MRIGYIRISKDKQTTALQEDAMRNEQCERVFTDKLSGKCFDRPEFLKMLDVARRGDVIVVWRLDRLGRSLKHLIETVTLLEERGIELKSLKENIDTTTPTGRLMFHFMGAMAEFERDLISERTRAGLEAARARGRNGGRPRKLKNSKLAQARVLFADKSNEIDDICATLHVSRATLYRAMKREGWNTAPPA